MSLFDSRGQSIKSYELSDWFDAEELQTLPNSVSSVHWRNGPAYIRPDQKTLLVTVKSGADLLFGLESGRYKYCEYPSAAAPQPNRQEDVHHEGHEDHEVRSSNYPNPSWSS